MIQELYSKLLEQERKWRINGVLQIPSYDDVEKAVQQMINIVNKSISPISVELGGVLVKRTDNHIDIYVHVGEA